MVRLEVNYLINNLFSKKTDLTVELIQATDQGLRNSFVEQMNIGEAIEVGAKNDLGISVVVTHDFWGAIPLRTVTANKGKLSFSKNNITTLKINPSKLYIT